MSQIPSSYQHLLWYLLEISGKSKQKTGTDRNQSDTQKIDMSECHQWVKIKSLFPRKLHGQLDRKELRYQEGNGDLERKHLYFHAKSLTTFRYRLYV